MSSHTAVSMPAIEVRPQPWYARRPAPRLVLLLPALIYLAALTQAPFVLTLWYSFHKWILTSPELGVSWVGLDNYNYTVLQDPIFRDAIVNTIVLTIGIVGLYLVLGFVFAL